MRDNLFWPFKFQDAFSTAGLFVHIRTDEALVLSFNLCVITRIKGCCEEVPIPVRQATWKMATVYRINGQATGLIRELETMTDDENLRGAGNAWLQKERLGEDLAAAFYLKQFMKKMCSIHSWGHSEQMRGYRHHLQQGKS